MTINLVWGPVMAKIIGMLGEFPPEYRRYGWFTLMVMRMTADPWHKL